MRSAKTATSRHSTEIMRAMQAIVAAIPEGHVLSYGEVARQAGFPRHARMVSRALAQSLTPLPWFRVVTHKGEIAARGLDGEDDLQRVLLEAEGIAFDAHNRIDMKRHAWRNKA
jgi:methylated-DNA-protein-cysteine methyltransferase-like protein